MRIPPGLLQFGKNALEIGKEVGKWSITPTNKMLLPAVMGALPAYWMGEDSMLAGGIGGLAGAFLAPRFGPAASLLAGMGVGTLGKKIKRWREERALRQLMEERRRQMMAQMAMRQLYV